MHFSQSCLRDDSEKMFSEPGRFFQPYLNLNMAPPFRFFVSFPELLFFAQACVAQRSSRVFEFRCEKECLSKSENNVFSTLLLLIVEAPATVAQTSSYSALLSGNEALTHYIHLIALRTSGHKSSQLKHFKLSSVAEPRRQSDPEGGRPCSLLVCLLTSMWVQALIWWSERLFLLSLSLAFCLSLKLSVAHSRLSIQEHCTFCKILRA